MIRIEYLADHMAFAATLAKLHHDQWCRLLPGWSQTAALEELSSHRKRRAIPTTLLALAGGDLLGSVSLLAVDHERLAHLAPGWQASSSCPSSGAGAWRGS